MQSFPTHRYHAKHGSKILKNAEELAKLPKDWHDCPSKAGLVAIERNGHMHFDKAENAAVAEPVEGEELAPAPKGDAGKKGEGAASAPTDDAKPAGPKAKKPRAGKKGEGAA